MTLILFTVGFAGAAALGAYLSWGAAAAVPLGLAAVAAWLVLFLRRRGERPRWVALGVGLALLWLTAYGALFQGPVALLDGRTGQVQAEVSGWPYETDYGASIPVRIGAPGGRTVKGLLYGGYDCLDLRPGDRLVCRAKCTSARTVRGEDSLLYVSRGIQLRGTIRDKNGVSRIAADGVALRYAPAYLAQAIRDEIDRLYPERAAGFLHALLTGDRNGLDEGDRHVFNRTGLGHVVVISGLHVTFLLGVLLFFLRRRGMGTFVAVTATLVLFCLMTGSAPGTVRAVVLCAIALLGDCIGRESHPPTSLCAGLMVLLLADPFAIANAGLQFSFLSTLGILLFGRRWSEGWLGRLPRRWRRFARPVLGVVAISLGAMLFTVPLSALYFGRCSLVAPLANLLVGWTVSLAFLGGLASVLLGAVWLPLGQAAAALVQWPIDIFYAGAHALARWPLAAITTDAPWYAGWLVAAYAALIVCLLLPRQARWRGRIRALCGGGAAVGLALAVVCTFASVRTAPLTFAAIDVAQGQSLTVWSGGKCALIDCGGSIDPGDEAATYLQARGRTSLDLLVLTHFHRDHAGGVPELMERIRVKRLIVPETDLDDPLRAEILALAEEKGIAVETVTETAVRPLGRGTLTLVPPLPAETASQNERCLAILVSCGAWDALVTGDMPRKDERALLERVDLPDLELLVVGHHGSKYSTDPKLLDALRPEEAIVSVGYNNYGHPTPETLGRLAERGIDVYRTDELGTVTIATDGRGD